MYTYYNKLQTNEEQVLDSKTRGSCVSFMKMRHKICHFYLMTPEDDYTNNLIWYIYYLLCVDTVIRAAIVYEIELYVVHKYWWNLDAFGIISLLDSTCFG